MIVRQGKAILKEKLKDGTYDSFSLFLKDLIICKPSQTETGNSVGLIIQIF